MKLTNWSDIDLTKIQSVNMEKRFSANSITVFRIFEDVFEGYNKDVEAYQCPKCGNLFMIGKDNIKKLKDENGEKICFDCAGINDPNQEKTQRWKDLSELIRLIQLYKQTLNSQLIQQIRRISQSYFSFNSIPELEVEVHKLTQKVRSDNMGGRTLPDEYRKIIDDKLDNIRNINRGELEQFVFSINHTEEHEIQETINMLQASTVRAELEYWIPKISQEQIVLSIGIRTKNELDRLRLKLTLLIYGQLVEFDFVYYALYNLGLLNKGKKFIKEPFPPDKNGNLTHPNEKIRLIKQMDTELGRIIDSYYSSPLRNAIAHSKYYIDNNYVHKTDAKSWKMPIIQVKQKCELAQQTFSYTLHKIANEQAVIMEKKLNRNTKQP